MRYGKNLKRLLKIAQENNTADWQAVKAEVESEELPPGIVDVQAINESNESAKELLSKAQEAKASVDSMSEEDKRTLGEAWNDKGFWEMANQASGGKISTSGLIDALFVKKASEYIDRNDAIEIIREINLYNSLNSSNIKIASNNDIKRAVILKAAAFEKLCSDNAVSILKISRKYSNNLIKEADGSLWDAAKGIGSKVLDTASSGLKYIKDKVVYGFKFIGTVLPFIGVFLSAKHTYNAYINVTKSLAKAKEHFSNLGSTDLVFNPISNNSDSIFNSHHIKKLIEQYKEDPKVLLKVAQLNKVAKFYVENWLEGLYSVLWFVSDLIMSIGVVATVIGTGGAAAAIEAPLAAMAAEVIGPAAAKWAGRAGVASFAGSLLTGLLGVGVNDYDSNSSLISGIADGHLSAGEAVTRNEYRGIPEEEPSNREMTDEEAFRIFDEFAKNYKQ